ncbi:MAG: peptidoglycan DD-metalloendopeptidase family protein [Candidatus Macondimonas sp.]
MALAGVAALLYLPFNVLAEKNEARLARIESRIVTLERQIDKDRSIHGRAVAALKRAEQALAEATRKTNALQEDLAAGEQRLAATQTAIHKQEIQLRRNRATLSAQLRARQAMGDDPWLKVFLSPTDPARTGRWLTYLQYLQQSQIDQIDAARDQLTELARLRAAAREEQETTARLLTEQVAATESLRQARAERERAVKRLAGTLASRGKAIEQLQSDRARLEKLIVDLPAAETARQAPSSKEVLTSAASATFPRGSFRRLKGRMGWPVQGVIKARFGTERQEGRMQWQGLLIGAPEGAQVHAVADGEVLFTAWMPHYGLVGIVDHGDGFLSLYGHNQTLLRRPGERVRAGEVLGRVGTSGGRATPALYFEIRQGGNPVNPERWLAANRK